ncbi:MAG: hypothetical protein ACFCUO_12265 [Rhodospirillales bacterium]
MTAACTADEVRAGLRPESLLWAWEHGSRRQPVDRALVMLKAALPSCPDPTLAALSIAERDSLLLRIRVATFGALIDAQAACPACGTTVTFTTDAESLLQVGGVVEPAGDLCVAAGGYRVRLRAPDSRDLAAAATTADAAAARAVLLRRMIDGAWRDGAPIAPDELPEALIAEAIGELANRQGCADITFALSCPNCGHPWSAPLDAASFLWAEIATEAERVARAVDTLARTYGWSEAAILAMSAPRRHLYLQLAG